MTLTNEKIMDNREVAAELAKLPELVQLEIVGMIKGAQLISETRLVSNSKMWVTSPIEQKGVNHESKN